MNLSEAAAILRDKNIQVKQIGNADFSRFANLDHANGNTAVFLHGRGSDRQVEQRLASLLANRPAAVITSADFYEHLHESGIPVLLVNDPRLSFSILAEKMNGSHGGIDPTAIVHPWAYLGSRVTIGPFTVVGSEGLNANRHDDVLNHTTHVGEVAVGNDVWVGPHCSIQRAVVGQTTIGPACHIDNRVVVGHGCSLGCRVSIAAGTVLCGTCIIEDDVWIGANSVIREGLIIGREAFVGIGSVVTKDVPSGAIVAGNPARIMPNGRRPW